MTTILSSAKKILITLTSIAVIFLSTITHVAAASTSLIKHGKGIIRLKIDNASDLIQEDTLQLELYYLPPFQLDTKSILGEWSMEDNAYECIIPMDLSEMLTLLRISSRDSLLALGLLNISQDSTTQLVASYDSQGLSFKSVTPLTAINKHWTDGSVGLTNNPTNNIGQITQKFHTAFPRDFIDNGIDCEEYLNWKTMSSRLDTAFVTQLHYSTEDYSMPEDEKPWLTRYLKNQFIALHYLNYQALANLIGCSIPTYPVEYYTFLNDIDFGEDFFNYLPVGYNPYFIFSRILSNFDSIPTIGEIPGKEWQQIATESFAKAGITVSSDLLDLLLATSYLTQIKKGEPLTDIQKNNIKVALGNDLSKIIFAADEEAQSLQANIG